MSEEAAVDGAAREDSDRSTREGVRRLVDEMPAEVPRGVLVDVVHRSIGGLSRDEASRMIDDVSED